MTETYRTAIRDFDHEGFSRVGAYPRLRRALSDLANEAEASLSDLLEALRDMAVTAPCGDMCENCDKSLPLDERIVWPYHGTLTDSGTHLGCEYHCARCGHRWFCSWTSDPSKLP